MDTDIVTDQLPGADAAAPTTGTPKYAPEDHAKASALEVIRLVELGTGAHGKTATFEFAGGFVRTIDVDEKTVWHDIFRSIEGGDWRRLLKHVAPRSKAADGTIVVQIGPMWFWTARMTPRGRGLGCSHFDVPCEDYSAGRLTGARAARELIMFLKQYERARVLGPWRGLEGEIHACLQEAFALNAIRVPCDALSTANAAITFCQIVTRFFFAGGAAQANPAYLDEQVTTAEASLAWSLDFDERARQETANRMRIAREAKAAKRATSVGQGARSLEGVTRGGHTLQ